MYAYINIYIFIQKIMKKPWTWRREARDIGMGLEERQRRETCNSTTISKNKQKRKVVYNSVLNFEFLFYCNSWLFSVLRTALHGRWSHIWVIFKTFLFIYPIAIRWYTKMIFNKMSCNKNDHFLWGKHLFKHIWYVCCMTCMSRLGHMIFM